MSKVLKLPGIYSFRNTITKEQYIGGTRNLQSRRRHHWSDLKLQRHRNSNLQSAYNKYGADVFEFVVLEYLDETSSDEDIKRKEQYWMNFISPEYNVKNAVGEWGSSLKTDLDIKLAQRKGRKQSDEEKRKRSESMKWYWSTRAHNPLSEETKRKISKAVSGKNHPLYGIPVGEKRKKKIADGVSKIEYVFEHLSGKRVTFRNLKSNARDVLGIPAWRASRLSCGELEEYDGWKFIEKRCVK